MPEIAFLTLANHAEVRDGFLYVSGGEWDTVIRAYQEGETPTPHRLSIAMTVVVDWHETNQPHHVSVRLEDEDGHRLVDTGLDLEVGRPPGRTPGTSIRTPFALNADVAFPGPGGYRAVAELAGSTATYPFRVEDRITPNR